MHKLRDAPGEIEEDLKTQLEGIAGSGKVYVLGLGNTDRADDGAGVMVALALKRLFPAHSYSEHDGVEGTVLDISERNEDATVFFVDAAELGTEAGSIKIVMREEIKDTEITTHRVAIGLMASILNNAGLKSAVICIQPKDIMFGGRVSPSVEISIERIVTALTGLMSTRNG
jgi:hydrogenase maturation protease